MLIRRFLSTTFEERRAHLLSLSSHLRHEHYPNYNAHSVPKLSLIQAREQLLDKSESSDNQVLISPVRISAKRVAGKNLIFLGLQAEGVFLQAVISLKTFEQHSEDEDALTRFQAIKKLQLGDIIELQGKLSHSQTGEPSIYAHRIQLLTPCLHEIPFQLGLSLDRRLRQRHLDFILRPCLIQHLQLRDKAIRYLRHFLQERQYVEVETPSLVPQIGGANARPFVTQSHALQGDYLYLRIAPELYLKQLVIGGMPRVFEIGRQFRNEGVDATHQPEFTTCEAYMACTTLEETMEMIESLIQGLVQIIPTSKGVLMDRHGQSYSVMERFERIKVVPTIEQAMNMTLPSLRDVKFEEMIMEHLKQQQHAIPHPPTATKLLECLVDLYVLPKCKSARGPVFVTDPPLCSSPLAQAHRDSLNEAIPTAQRFELYVGSTELVNGYVELNDPIEQRDRFMLQQQERVRGDVEAQPLDAAYCQALMYGLPPTCGWGIGLERLMMMLTGSDNIRDVVAFPMVRQVQEPIKENIKL